MVKNNIIEEIQELIQQIKNEYQEGVDFEFVAPNLINRATGGFHVKILSPRLKKYWREKLGLPLGDIEHLDFEKGDSEENDLYYRIYESSYGYDVLDCAKEKLYRFSNNKEEPKKCKGCGELTSYERGQVVEWSGKNWGEIFGYFHSECAKKYFADKEQSNENNSRIKEKLLRNLDKISFDQAGHLANAELLKLPYEYGTQQKEKVGVYRIKIDKEEINLRDFDREENEKNYLEIRDAIVDSIKKNISDWEIKNDEYNKGYLQNKKSGVKVWKIIFCEIAFKNGGQDWAEIKNILKGPNASINDETEINNIELTWLKTIFQKLKISKIIFENDKLTVIYDNNKTISVGTDTNNSEYQALEKYCQKHQEREITKEQLGLGSDNNLNNTDNSPLENKYLWLVGGIGVGIIIAVVAVFVCRRPRKQKK